MDVLDAADASGWRRVDPKLADCLCCGLRKFDYLDAPPCDAAVPRFGRNAVQVLRVPVEASSMLSPGSFGGKLKGLWEYGATDGRISFLCVPAQRSGSGDPYWCFLMGGH